MTVADRIGVMDARPARAGRARRRRSTSSRDSRWVADFIGDVNLFEGAARRRRARPRAIDRTRRRGRSWSPQAGDAPGQATASGSRCGPRRCADRAARPAGDGELRRPASVADIGYLGDVSIYKVRLDDRR